VNSYRIPGWNRNEKWHGETDVSGILAGPSLGAVEMQLPVPVFTSKSPPPFTFFVTSRSAIPWRPAPPYSATVSG
jgi:hypothetical protein